MLPFVAAVLAIPRVESVLPASPKPGHGTEAFRIPTTQKVTTSDAVSQLSHAAPPSPAFSWPGVPAHTSPNLFCHLCENDGWPLMLDVRVAWCSVKMAWPLCCSFLCAPELTHLCAPEEWDPSEA